MTIGDRIQLYAGTVASTTELQEFIDEAARLVIAELPEAVLLPMASELTDSGSGVSVADKRVLSAHKSGYEAPRMEENLRARITEETNSYEAKQYSPAYYILGTTAYVVPDGGTVVAVATPTILYTDTTVSGLPHAILDMIVFKAAEFALQNKLVDTQEAFTTTITLPSAPSTPSAPSISYTDAAAVAPSAVSIAALPTAPTYTAPSLAAKPSVPTVGTLDLTKKVDGVTALAAPTAPSAPSIAYSDATAATISATSISALPTVPTYNTSTFGGDNSLPTLPADLDLTDEIDAVTALDPPTAPSAPAITYSNASAATAAATILSALGTAPAYTKPSFAGSLSIPTLPTLDLTKEIDGTTALDPPALPSAPSIAAVDAAAATTVATTISALGTAPAFTKPTFGGSIASITSAIPAAVSLVTEIDNATTLTCPTPPIAPTLSSAGLSGTVTVGTPGTPPSYTTGAASLDYTDWTTYKGEEDPEMMARILEKIATTLREHEADMADNRNSFESSTQLYRGDLERLIAQARTTLEENIAVMNQADQMALQDYVQGLAQYDRDLAEYQEKVKVQIDSFQANMARAVTGLAEAERLYIQQYRLDIDSEVAEFQKELAAYQQDAQHKIEQARITLQEAVADAQMSTDTAVRNEANTLAALIRDWEGDIEFFKLGLERYAAEIQRVKEEWDLDYKKAVEPWSIEQSNQLALYQQDIANEVNEFQKEVVAYQQDANHKVEQARITLQEAIADARASTDIAAQNAAKALESLAADYDRELARFQAQLQTYSAEVERQVQQFNANYQKAFEPWREQQSLYLQEYAQDVAAERDRFQGQMQDHMREVDRIIQQAQITAQEALTQAQLTTDTALKNEAQTLAAAVQDYESELTLYRAKTELYGLETNAVVQQFAQDLDRSIQLFSMEGQLDTSRFGAEVQDAMNAFQEELALYQAGVERNNLQAQIARQEAQQTAQNSTDIDVQNQARTLEAAIAQYQATLSRHQDEIRLYAQQAEIAISERRAASTIATEKLRMMHFDLERIMNRYQEAKRGAMRYLWPFRTFTIQMPVI